MLILTEKPNVAKEFAAVLGCSRRDGYFESDKDCVVWAVGHLLELFTPGEYFDKWEKWSLSDLPILPQQMNYKPVEKTEAQLKIIKACFKKWGKSELLLATDAEREGELIGATILDYAEFTGYENAKRFWVSEALTDNVIKKGIAGAKPLDEYSAYKNEGYARQHADWLVGMNLSRIACLKFNMPGLSVGRVQTPVLAAIYAREKSIGQFQKTYYYQAALTLEKDKNNFTLYLTQEKDDEENNKFASGKDDYLSAAMNACKGAKDAEIIKVKTETKKMPPPQLYNLTGLQKDANKRFGYSPAETLEIAQRLYETHKALSYPRTPSKVLGDDNVELFKEKYDVLSKTYPEFAEGTDETKITGASKRIFNTSELRDHHALIPLAPLSENAPEQERNVYTLVLDRFFTQLKSAYVYESLAVSAGIGEYIFSGTGKRVIEAGWKKGYAGDEDEDNAEDFPALIEHERVEVKSIETLQKETKPKPHFTEATLLQMMENPRGDDNSRLAGLGTPATRAGIIKALFDKGYITQEKKNILITAKGTFLIENLLKNKYLARFTSLRETTDWEQKLADNPQGFLDGIKSYLVEAVPAVTADTACEAHKAESLGKCPVCGEGVIEGKKSFYCAGYKAGCKFVLWKNVCGATVNEKDARLLLSGKLTADKKFTKKDGKTWTAQLKLTGQEVTFLFDGEKKK